MVMLRQFLCLIVAATPLVAAQMQVSSPDKSIILTFRGDAKEHLTYSITANGKERFGAATAGVIVNGVNSGSNALPLSVATRDIRETFPRIGGKTSGTNHCIAATIPLRSANGQEWSIEARVFNDGAAFRYRIPGNGPRHINGESTKFSLPKQARAWFQTNTREYEGEFVSTNAADIPLIEGEKKTSVHLGPPVTLEFEDGTFGLVSEAALFRYSGMTLRALGEGQLAAAFQDDPQGWQHEGEILSPFRVFILCKDLTSLVNCDVIPALCDPPDPTLFPDGPNSDWLRPGKAPCTWMVYGNDGAQWDRQKWFVDVAAATGCEYLLVDAGWRTEKWGWMKNGGDLWGRAAELCRYAAERKVGIVLWHAYPEGRDDSPGLTTTAARDELFKKCKEAGVKGVKIDFFDSESRQVVDAYEDLLRRAATNRIMVNFHGTVKPTGESRTWPNEVTREGVREQEYVLWGSLGLQHYGALPFTRMAVGTADFLPGYVQKKFLKNTTVTFQMASVVVFSSPFLCWPDNPEAYLASPLLQFVRDVPVTWDETRVLPGSQIGSLVLMARRKADQWYVAALNCQSEERTVELDLSFIDFTGKDLQLYSDGAEPAAAKIETLAPAPNNKRLSFIMKPGGGVLLQVKPRKEFPGWK